MQSREVLRTAYARLSALQHFLPVLHAAQNARLQYRERRKTMHASGGATCRNHRPGVRSKRCGGGNNGQCGAKKRERDGTSGHENLFFD
ncbi:hypothetical protein GGI1_20933 [Acidithiobacillus sp. GGI-221]|nr:hypothetical protein GGI1_20933 [Acidithiobacillus sp. GGI-221]